MSFDPDRNEELLPNPPALHPATLDEVEGAFVWPDMPQRREIWGYYTDHVSALRALVDGEPVEEWLDGGFTTFKEQPPKDIDFVAWLGAGLLNSLDPEEQGVLSGLFNTSHSACGIPRCDAYLVPVFEEGGPGDEVTKRWRAYWSRQFGYQRDEDGGRAKGIVQVTV